MFLKIYSLTLTGNVPKGNLVVNSSRNRQAAFTLVARMSNNGSSSSALRGNSGVRQRIGFVCFLNSVSTHEEVLLSSTWLIIDDSGTDVLYSLSRSLLRL